MHKRHASNITLYFCSKCYTKVVNVQMVLASQELLTSTNRIFLSLQLFRNKNFVKEVHKHQFQNIKNAKTESLRDIYDGKLYQNLFKQGHLQLLDIFEKRFAGIVRTACSFAYMVYLFSDDDYSLKKAL